MLPPSSPPPPPPSTDVLRDDDRLPRRLPDTGVRRQVAPHHSRASACPGCPRRAPVLPVASGAAQWRPTTTGAAGFCEYFMSRPPPPSPQYLGSDRHQAERVIVEPTNRQPGWNTLEDGVPPRLGAPPPNSSTRRRSTASAPPTSCARHCWRQGADRRVRVLHVRGAAVAAVPRLRRHLRRPRERRDGRPARRTSPPTRGTASSTPRAVRRSPRTSAPDRRDAALLVGVGGSDARGRIPHEFGTRPAPRRRRRPTARRRPPPRVSGWKAD